MVNTAAFRLYQLTHEVLFTGIKGQEVGILKNFDLFGTSLVGADTTVDKDGFGSRCLSILSVLFLTKSVVESVRRSGCRGKSGCVVADGDVDCSDDNVDRDGGNNCVESEHCGK